MPWFHGHCYAYCASLKTSEIAFKYFSCSKIVLKVKVDPVCMAYGNMIAFVLSMLTFIVVSANLENFHVDKHKVEKWNNKQ